MTAEPTASFQPADATGPYIPTAPADRPDGEIQRLLRKRLRVIVLILAAFYAAQLTRSVSIHLHWLAGPPVRWPVLTFFALILATAIGFAVVLWSGRPVSLRGLRAIELVTFLQMAAFAAWITQAELRSEWVRRYVTADDLDGMVLTSRAHALNWFALIVLYGTLIPNTWRRCAAVAGAMALTPLAVGAAVGLTDETLRTRLLPGYLTDIVLWVAAAVAIAVYGCYRIELLHREVAEARQLGQYQLPRKLGVGGMGEVWLAEHRLLKRPCAVKFIRPDLAAHPSTAARFEREVRAITALTHFNTIRVYDYGRADDGGFYYVMEYLAGPTLDALVKQAGPLDPARVVYVLRQVCGALAEAHAAGLVHRDIKPGNVIVAALGGQYDVAKLLDFGLVQDLAVGADDRLTQMGTVLGTPAYMCPEQAGGGAAVDARGDVYSLGAVAFFALTGRPPFEAQTVGAYLSAHLTKPAPDVTEVRKDVPADLAAIVARCLAKNPTDRFQTVGELERAIAACGCAGGWDAARAAEWWARRETSSG
jgi:serine/threonine-protein kinase